MRWKPGALSFNVAPHHRFEIYTSGRSDITWPRQPRRSEEWGSPDTFATDDNRVRRGTLAVAMTRIERGNAADRRP